MKNIETVRSQIINKIKVYSSKLDKKSDFYSVSSHMYFSSQESTLAYSKINFWTNKKKNFFKYFFQIFKHFFSISINGYPQIKNSKNFLDHETIIETWALKKNFLKDGSLNDRYFNINSRKNKKILWIVIYLDEDLPSKIDENILLIFRKRRKFPDFLYLFQYIFRMLIRSNLNLKKFYHTLSFQSCFAFQNYEIIKNFILIDEIKNFLFPYEGQPFQNLLISEIKKKNKNIKSIGYIHYTHPFQLEIINRKGSPDRIYTYSPDQLKFFKKLNWRKKRISLIPALSHKRNEDQKNKLKSKIFFPYKLSNEIIVLDILEDFIKNNKNYSLPFFRIAPHPSPYNLKKQQKLEKDIQKLMKDYKKKFSSSVKENFSIVIGLTTSIFVAIENGIRVIHISLDPIRDQLSTKLWPNVRVKSINNNLNIYSLKKKNSCILINNKVNNFEKFILDKII